ncbi:cytidine deaminase [Vibrio hippocampi]|uniref:Cytidine deaminase n=1 Tax=Vibrio hippocampi TaxID=654686 RepID=A0ABN8DH93_9VIBR|nr:cytidine deaminase [Vibrio hippocampi]CAH0526029.1 Cytidine deaminase [Vibrio hippocampi]
MAVTFESALADIPNPIAQSLRSIVSRPNFDATLSAQEFQQLLDLSGLSDDELRVALLPIAACYSYATISEFYVGAIVRGVSGKLYFGANMEFRDTQLGQTIHAEQSAISHAWMNGETGIKDITINYSPCGHCRQFMNELTTADSLSIQLPQVDEQTLAEYLPQAFGPSDLGIKDALMSQQNHAIDIDIDTGSAIISQAAQAFSSSYAPYSRNYSGVALETRTGQIYRGSYAENAAFNPSLPPLQVALSQLILNGALPEHIVSAALIEVSDSKISHLGDTQATLEAINPDIEFEYISL